MSNFILVDPRRVQPLCMGEVVEISPAPPPPMAAPLKAWEEPKAPDPFVSPASKGPRPIFLIIEVDECDGETDIQAFETEAERDKAWDEFLERVKQEYFREEPRITLEEVEQQYLQASCHSYAFPDAMLGGYDAYEKKQRLEKHFEHEFEKLRKEKRKKR